MGLSPSRDHHVRVAPSGAAWVAVCYRIQFKFALLLHVVDTSQPPSHI